MEMADYPSQKSVLMVEHVWPRSDAGLRRLTTLVGELHRLTASVGETLQGERGLGKRWLAAVCRTERQSDWLYLLNKRQEVDNCLNWQVFMVVNVFYIVHTVSNPVTSHLASLGERQIASYHRLHLCKPVSLVSGLPTHAALAGSCTDALPWIAV